MEIGARSGRGKKIGSKLSFFESNEENTAQGRGITVERKSMG